MRPEGAPRVDAARAMPLRLGMILLSYGIYRVTLGDGLAVAILLGAGSLIVGYMAITRLTTRPSERSHLMQTGQAVLGGGLILAGLLRLGGFV